MTWLVVACRLVGPEHPLTASLWAVCLTVLLYYTMLSSQRPGGKKRGQPVWIAGQVPGGRPRGECGVCVCVCSPTLLTQVEAVGDGAEQAVIGPIWQGFKEGCWAIKQ